MSVFYKGFITFFILFLFVSCSHKKESGLRVATYNSHYMEGGLSNIILTLRESKAEVIALQEVLVTGQTPTSAAIAAALGYYHIHSATYVQRQNDAWCLSILSKYPISNFRDTGIGTSRKALSAEIKMKNQSITVITMHLTPLSGRPPVKEEILRRLARRKQEIQDLLTFAKKINTPLILMGDFNMLRGTFGLWGMDEYDMLLDAGFQDADGGFFLTNYDTFPLPEQTIDSIARTIPRFLVPKSVTLDYIFLSGQIKKKNTLIMKSGASDHWPLIADIIVYDENKE